MHVVGTAGHVDHGKSTLVVALTGIDPDRFEEEKRRGLTIDLGFAWGTLPSGREYGVVDVPGHEKFIRNMLAGVGGVDATLFVVAADEGWMPQSAEHLQILDFLDVRHGIVVLTKTDLVPDDLVELAAEEVRDQTRGTVLSDAPIVGVSAVAEHGLDELKDALDALLSEVATSEDRGRPRLFVDRAFTITGAGTVVTGTLTGGTLQVGEEVELLPEGQTVRIRGLQTHHADVQEAVPGSRVAANLVGIDRHEVDRGDALVRPGTFRTTEAFAARLRATRGLAHPLTERGAYELFCGSVETTCRIKFLETAPDREGRDQALPPGESILVEVFASRPIPLEPDDRFVVRDVGRWETVAGGIVLDQLPGKIRRGDEKALERLGARERADRPDLVGAVVGERGVVARDALGPLTGAGPEEVAEALAAHVEAGDLVEASGFVLDAAHAERLAARTRDLLADYHEAHHLADGMPREELRQALDLEPRPFGALLETWGRDGIAEAAGAVVRLPGRGTTLGDADRRAADRALETLRDGGVSPPDPSEVGLSPGLLRALERRGEIVVAGESIAYPTDVWEGIERTVAELIASEGPATVARVRDAVGTTRKYAVPMLERLDAAGVTRRRGDERVLGPRGKELAGEA